MQSSLFAHSTERLTESAAAGIRFVPAYLDIREADGLFDSLKSLPGWRQDHIRVYGKTHPLPRLHRWFTDSNEPYRWSGISMHPEPFPEFLDDVRCRLAEESGVHFNTALGNFYRDGRDGVSWHSDDEPELGTDPVIASLSLGATRRFLMRKKLDHSQCLEFDLTHGSLLWMSGDTQIVWQHSIPKTSRTVESRINLTFRAICAMSDQPSTQ
jgi:alkylated DNA repair dioxygenase AlkB